MVSRYVASRATGDRAVMATKKPGKLSSGTPWENLEFFPTPPWATRALLEKILPELFTNFRPNRVWDPCAGMGHMLAPLREYFSEVHGSDIYAYPGADPAIVQNDILDPETVWPFEKPGIMITNPPFTAAADILARALQMQGCVGVAMLLRLQWLCSETRYESVFKDYPPRIVAPFSERVPMCLGGYDPNGSTATDYAWFVWRPHAGWIRPHLIFIPPCRAALTRDSDRALAALHVPGFVAPSTLKKRAAEQENLDLDS